MADTEIKSALFSFYNSYGCVIEDMMKANDHTGVAELVMAMYLDSTGRSEEISFTSPMTHRMWMLIKPNILNSSAYLENKRKASANGEKGARKKWCNVETNVDERRNNVETTQTNVDEPTTYKASNSAGSNVEQTQNNVRVDERRSRTYVDVEKWSTLKASNGAEFYVEQTPHDGVSQNPNMTICNDMLSKDMLSNDMLHNSFFKNACAYEEAKTYHEEKKYKSSLKEWWSYWSVRNWEIGGKKMVNWQASIDNWESGYQKKIKKNDGNCMKLSYTDQEMRDLEQKLLTARKDRYDTV